MDSQEASKTLNNLWLQNKGEKCLFLQWEAPYVWVPFIVQGVKLSFVSLLASLGSQHRCDNAENDCDRSHLQAQEMLAVAAAAI